MAVRQCQLIQVRQQVLLDPITARVFVRLFPGLPSFVQVETGQRNDIFFESLSGLRSGFFLKVTSPFTANLEF